MIDFYISNGQVDSFKEHARLFANALKSIDTSYKLQGRKRYDCLAQVCGYVNHSQLTIISKNVINPSPLELFNSDIRDTMASRMAQHINVPLDDILDAMTIAHNRLIQNRR